MLFVYRADFYYAFARAFLPVATMK